MWAHALTFDNHDDVIDGPADETMLSAYRADFYIPSSLQSLSPSVTLSPPATDALFILVVYFYCHS